MIISGIARLTKDPKMQYTDKGTAQTTLSLVSNSGYGDKQKATWISAICWGALAEVLNKNLSKGKRIDLVAEVSEIRSYSKTDGGTGTSLDVKILKVEFIDFSDKKEQEDEGEFAEPEEF